MILDRSEQHPGARFLLLMASGVVVVWGLQFAAPILLPFSLALFLAVLSLPLMLALQRRRVPAPLAIALAVLVDVGVFGLLVLLASQSVAEFQVVLPRYIARLQDLQQGWLLALEERLDLPVRSYVDSSLFDAQAVAQAVVEFAGSTIQRAASFLSQVFLVFLIMVFILAEATVFPDKLRVIVGPGRSWDDRLAKVIKEVQEYLGIKTVVSLMTGLLLGVWCWAMNLDFPVLLGLIAFVLNYVPTVGSIIAAVPAVLLSIILQGTVSHAFLVALGYVIVNTGFGNILEPSLMGRRLGLSTLVVILSLLFWGWTWGPVGALLSVPLTMVIKIWLENTQDLRWVAVLLDKHPRPMVPVEGGVTLQEVTPVLVDDDRGA
jgi:predicted PurR-regulated permease PerM